MKLDDIEKWKEKKALYFDGMMDDDYELVRKILKNNPDLVNAAIDVPMDQDDIDDGIEIEGKTPLLEAISFSDLTMVKLLVEEFDAEINKGAYDYMTPIYKLSYHKTQKTEGMVDYLLNNGADVNIAIDTGKTPLMSAAQDGSMEIVKKLLEHGADANAKDLDDSNVFFWLGYYDGEQKTKEDEENIEAIVKILLEYGADINYVDKYDMTGLKMAEKYDNPMVAKVLKKYMNLYPKNEESTPVNNNTIPDDFMK